MSSSLRCSRYGVSRGGLVLLAALPAALAKLVTVNPPGCGEFKDGDGVAAPLCGNKTKFACGPDQKPIGFIHIPKSAGTTIEEVGLNHGVRWGRFHKSGDPRKICIDNDVHGAVDFVPVNPPYTSYQAAVVHLFADTLAWCNHCHVPPHRYHGEHNPYDEGENFCVLRNPYQRAVSDYKFIFCYEMYEEEYSIRGATSHNQWFDIPTCNPEGLNHVLQVGIRRVMNKDPLYMFRADCHFLPQYEFAFGPDGRQWCHHQLKFEELPHSFNSFMEKQGLPMRMSGSVNPSSCGKRKCNVTVNDLTPETRALIREAYSKDFELGGYAP